MKLFPASPTYRYPGTLSVVAGGIAGTVGFGVLWALQFLLGTNLPQPLMAGVLVAVVLIAMVWAGTAAALKSIYVLDQLKMRVKGSYGIELTNAELNTLLPIEHRFGWDSGSGAYGTISREVNGVTERRMLTRQGDIFHLDKVFALEFVEEPLKLDVVS